MGKKKLLPTITALGGLTFLIGCVLLVLGIDGEPGGIYDILIAVGITSILFGGITLMITLILIVIRNAAKKVGG